VRAAVTWSKRLGAVSTMGVSCCRQHEALENVPIKTDRNAQPDQQALALLACNRRLLCHGLQEDGDDMDPSQRVNITIRIAGARGLPDMDWLSGVDRILYCVVRSASEGDFLFRTGRTKSMLDPVWNEQKSVLAPLGKDSRGLFLDSLCFQVYEEDEEGHPWLLAKAYLDLTTLGTNPGGDAFMGELPLEVTGGHCAAAFLAIEVRPSSSSPAQRISMERNIVIDNPRKKKLGLNLDGGDGSSLFVNSVKKGSPIEEHNSFVDPPNWITAGQFIVCVNGICETSSAMMGALMRSRGRTHLVIRNSIQFRAALPVMKGLGVRVPKRPVGISLLINGVDDTGAVATWNKSNPAQAIKTYDRVVAVNGKRAKAAELLKLARATPKFARTILTVVRMVPNAEGIESEFSTATLNL